jgi:UDP-N-acetylmuramoyl-L-alanyl-D-glutamate--2,6-diaminopimelate ligase
VKKLTDILSNIAVVKTSKSYKDLMINAIQYDSRKIGEGDVFVALKGVETDGHLFVDKAVQNGAKTIVVEEWQTKLPDEIVQIQVASTHLALALMAANYYDNPSGKLQLVGITGTNGKTTTASLSYELFKAAGFKAGLLSTVVIKIDDKSYPATHTTPDPLMINYYLNEMLKQNVQYVFMEVSSHGIDQKRTAGLQFKGGVFTNLTHDHLDYHKTFIQYRDTKKQFFDQLPDTAFALVNIDDRNGMFMLQNTKAQKYTYALKNPANYKAKILERNFSGMLLLINNMEVWVRLVGKFNAYNILAVYAIAELLGIEPFDVLTYLSELKSVAGRFELIVSPEGKIAVVDYAHTPDALENVLKTINEIRPKNTEKLITIVGAGGNRDKTKRPEMAAVAARLSDSVIFTSDNPRDEEPDAIIDDMEAGVPGEYYKKTLRITDRSQAIRAAVRLANPGDIILIAGKGHEDYQIVKGVKFHFDDREEVKKYFGLI